MSPVAEVIKELGTLIVGCATLATSIAALVSTMKTKKLVNDRSDQLHEALEYKGMVKGIDKGIAIEKEKEKEHPT